MSKNQTALTMSPAAWGMLILLSIVWGCTFFFQEIAVRELPVFTIVAVRVTLAAAILYAILLAAKEALPRDWKVWRELFLLALPDPPPAAGGNDGGRIQVIDMCRPLLNAARRWVRGSPAR